MESFVIPPNSEIRLRSENNRSFYGANSLLSIKAVRVPFERLHSDIQLRISYRNLSGHLFSFPIFLYPPYFFAAVTPDFSDDMMQAAQFPFDWVEIHNEQGFEITISASLNTKLHSNLDDFHKKHG